jgi:hypothetical protein
MVRLNIEEHAFGDARLTMLGLLLGECYSHALGYLANLWHQSQTVQVCYATQKQIRLWTMCPHGDKIVQALEDTGYIKRVGDDLFEIRGNEAQIDSIVSRAKKGREAIQKRWERHKKLPENTPSTPQVFPENTPSIPQVSPLHSIPLHSIPLHLDTLYHMPVRADGAPAQIEKPEIKKSEKKKSARIVEWDDNDDLAPVFAAITSVAKYAQVFDREHDRRVIMDAAKRYSLSMSDLATVAAEFAVYYDGNASQKIKSPRGSLCTFFRNHSRWNSDSGPLNANRHKRFDARYVDQCLPEPDDGDDMLPWDREELEAKKKQESAQ